MECYSIRQYCQDRGEKKQKEKVDQLKAMWSSTILALLTVQAGFTAKLDWFNENAKSSTLPLSLPIHEEDEMDFISSFQDINSLQSPRLRATWWHCPAAAGAPSHRRAQSLHTLKSPAGISPSTTKTQLKQMDSFQAYSPPTHNNAHQHQTNKSCWETGAFCQCPHRGQVGNTCPWNSWAWGSRKSKQGRLSFSWFLPLFCYSKSQRSRPQTSFDSCITHFQAALLLALALWYLNQPKPQNVFWVQKHSTGNAR